MGTEVLLSQFPLGRIGSYCPSRAGYTKDRGIQMSWCLINWYLAAMIILQMWMRVRGPGGGGMM